MVGHGVGTAKGWKRRKQNPCLSGKIQGKIMKVALLYVGGKVSAPLILYGGFAFAYTFHIPWNREKQGLKYFY